MCVEGAEQVKSDAEVARMLQKRYNRLDSITALADGFQSKKKKQKPIGAFFIKDAKPCQ